MILFFSFQNTPHEEDRLSSGKFMSPNFGSTIKSEVMVKVCGSQSLRSLNYHKGSSTLQSPKRWVWIFLMGVIDGTLVKGIIFLLARVALTPRLL